MYLIILRLIYCIQLFISTVSNNNNHNNNSNNNNNDDDDGDDNENENDNYDNDNETITQKMYKQYLQHICCPFRKI